MAERHPPGPHEGEATQGHRQPSAGKPPHGGAGSGEAPAGTPHPSDEVLRVHDPKALACLAHPLRVDLFTQLALVDAATVSQLAEALDQPVSLVSYHLHQLARYGFVDEVPERARDRRERWWRRASRYVSFTASDFVSSPEGLQALSRVQHLWASKLVEAFEHFLVELPALEPAWVDAAGVRDDLLELTPEELTALQSELAEVVARHRSARTGRVAESRHRRQVWIALLGIPLSGARPAGDAVGGSGHDT